MNIFHYFFSSFVLLDFIGKVFNEISFILLGFISKVFS